MKQKIKIMKQKPDLSDDEIRSYMDFDKLLDARNHAMPFVSRAKLYVALGVILVATSVWLYLQTSSSLPVKSVSNEMPEVSPAINAPITKVDSVSNHWSDSGNKSSLENTPAIPSRIQKSKETTSKPIDPASVVSKQNHQPKESIEDSFIEAEPQDGYPNFYRYLNNSLRYPAESIRDSVQGVETVSFTVNAKGKPENIRVRQSLGKAFDEESMRVIQEMPAWKPAILNGKPVASQISIPLTFHMERLK